MKKRNKWLFEIGKKFHEARDYRITKLSDFEYGIKIPRTRCDPDKIAYVADWVYIVNIVAAVSSNELVWRALLMDNLAQSQVAKLARDLRASDLQPVTVFWLVFSTFGRDPFANFSFGAEVLEEALSKNKRSDNGNVCLS